MFFEKFSLDTTHFSQDGNQVILTGDRNFFKVFDMMEEKVMQIPMGRGKITLKETILKIESIHLIGFDERLGKFELSPDGSLIVFLNRNGRLHFVSAKVNITLDMFDFHLPSF